MSKIKFLLLFVFLTQFLSAQSNRETEARQWADSVFNSLTDDQRIAQLMIVRESSFTSKGPVYYDSLVRVLINQYNIGGICLFQGTPVVQANFVNEFQAMAQTPLMVCIDGEWGLGMRFDSVKPLKHPMMLGAMNDSLLVYDYGRLVGRQMKRMGIQVDYAPVVDINNNPKNPVINDRSFGENKYTVASYGLAYMHGMQDEGVMASAKHFPGHGDVSVDSHLDLPVINKSLEQLDTLELYPFKRLIEGGVASVMVGHLFVPAIDSTAHKASSISKYAVNGLLRDKLGFQGLTFTDALGMQGVAKYFPGGQIAAESLIAGNDMLCLPHNVPDAIAAIRASIKEKKLTWNDIYEKCKKVLRYKYLYGLSNVKPIDIHNLANDLNEGIDAMNAAIAENAITLLNNKDKGFFPLETSGENSVAYVGIGISGANDFARRIQNDFGSDNFYFDYKEGIRRILSTVHLLETRYKKVIVGVHGFNRYPARKYGISDPAIRFINQITANTSAMVFSFGNPYAVQYFCEAPNLVVCYEDDPITQQVAADMLLGKLPFKGRLPVSVCNDHPSGAGINTENRLMEKVLPFEVSMDGRKLSAIDSIVTNGIKEGAFPGAVVLAARDGKIFYEKAFGTYNYGDQERVSTQSIFDLASVTKILATTVGIMKLVDEKKVDLDKNLGTYLPWVRKSDKKNLTVRDILLHQAGLVSYIPFFKKLIDPQTGVPLPQYFDTVQSPRFSIPVAQNLYLRTDYEDSLYQTILESKLGKSGNYIYSDNDFIFLGKIIEQVSGLTLDQYVKQNFYDPMGLTETGFNPLNRFDKRLIIPTETEKHFRMQPLHGYVHDPGAALFGGVAGHAGLFSRAGDMAVLLQMLLNGGTFNNKRYLQDSTIKLFTAYNSAISRRGLGFDKPQKDNYTTTDKRPYPSRYASPLTYGHTGYTGTCVWVDPEYNLIYVFLSNRVNPDGGENLKISTMNIRGEIEDTLYRAIIPTPEEVLKREKISP